MYPGVVLLHNGPPTPDQQLTAALLRAGPGTVVTGAEACRRHGLPAREIHLLVPGTARGSGTLILERAAPVPAATDVGGFPVVSAARAVVDACRFMRSQDEATALIAAAIQRGRCTPADLQAEARTNRFGTKLVRTVLKDLGRAESVAERDARRLSRKIRLTTPHWNATIAGTDGLIIGRPDAWYDDVGLAWEIDSRAFHYGPRGGPRTQCSTQGSRRQTTPTGARRGGDLRAHPRAVSVTTRATPPQATSARRVTPPLEREPATTNGPAQCQPAPANALPAPTLARRALARERDQPRWNRSRRTQADPPARNPPARQQKRRAPNGNAAPRNPKLRRA
ncbi:hypothetical protein LX88_000209 [Lentzea californiensis]|nr:hypothetical protein [Lentzea californiensis]